MDIYMLMTRKNNTKKKYRKKQMIKICEYIHKETKNIKTAEEALQRENIIRVFERATKSFVVGAGFTFKEIKKEAV